MFTATCPTDAPSVKTTAPARRRLAWGRSPPARLAAALLALAPLGAAANINIVFDYSFDTSGFFGATQIALLDSAAAVYEARLTDTLGAIVGNGSTGLTFNAVFSNPATGASASAPGLSLATNEMRVYIGAYNLGAGTLGVGGPGGFSSTVTVAGAGAALSRGQTGYLVPGAGNDTDFGPWGGAISFNSTAAWYFDTNPATLEAFSNNDFYSVALHELGHVLGIGTADSWDAKVVGGNFVGPNSGVRPLSGDLGHWADGSTSTINGAGSFQTLMDPSIATGTRSLPTDLDWTGLQDVGWQVAAVPEPGAAGLMLAGLLGLAGWRRAQGAG